MRFILICLSVLGFATYASAEDQVTNFTLKNGMEVVVVEDHRAPVVVHMVWYRAGSADEPAGSSGIAHFLEHLMFKGTDTLTLGEFSATVARNGGRDNAFTSYDYTGYFQRVAADRLELMMQMESDRMVNLRLTENDVVTERNVVIEERNERTENSASGLFREQHNAALYMNHRYGVPIVGWRHEIEQLDMQDALDFYEQHYAPNNAILVVAGDVDPQNVRELAETYYGTIPAKSDLEPRARPQEPPQIAPRRLVYDDPRVAQPYLMRSYLAPERDPGDQKQAAALTLLAEVLGGSVTSVLQNKLQFETQTAVQSFAYYRGLSVDDSSFTIGVVPQTGISLEDAETAMDDAVASFMETGVNSEQLARIKSQLRAVQIYARDDVGAMANRYVRGLASGLTIADIESWPDILQSITEDDIMNAARDVFDLKKSVTGWLQAPKEG